ncbi:MAG TPA: hypothetical protein VEA37_13050 [Flavobacterium sp.]|nr:hypothetical protein [Flavobacterium sp.]
MQDLLNEEEFIKEEPYNPWKSFRLFYAIAVAEVLLFYGIRIMLRDAFRITNSLVLAIAFNLLPLGTALFMFYYRKENFLLETKTILLGLLGLVSVYAFIVALGTITAFREFEIYDTIRDHIAVQMIGFASTILFHFLLCSPVILIIAARRKKKIKLKTA